MALSTEAAQAAAWTQGVLRWALRPVQQKVYDRIHELWPRGRFTLEAHRRFGKDFVDITLVSERVLRHPGSRWLYVAPTMDQAVSIAKDQFQQLLKTCPPSLAPIFVATRATYEFPNGSIIAFHSAEPRNRHRMRGLRADGAVLSELRDMVGLGDLLGSVIGPALQYAPGGGMVLCSTTPPEDEEAEYNDWVKTEEREGRFMRITLADNTDATPEFIAQAIRDCGGDNTPAFLCEYMCQRVPRLERLVIPNVPAHAVVEKLNEQEDDYWTAIDPGGTDLTAILHGWHGPGGLHVESEWAASGVDVDAIVTEGSRIEGHPPRIRWFDKVAGSDILQRTLSAKDWRVAPATYGNPVDAARILRAALDREVVTISPMATGLLRCLRIAQWAKNEKGEQLPKFRRMERSGIGHADLLAALLLAVCNSAYVRRALGPEIREAERLKRMRTQAAKLWRR